MGPTSGLQFGLNNNSVSVSAKYSFQMYSSGIAIKG